MRFFAGSAELSAEAKYRDRLAGVIAENNINARVKTNKEDGGIYVILSPENAKKLAAALDKMNIIVYINNVRGLRSLLVSKCKRVGLLAGAVLFFTLLSLSTLFVFKVEVSGSELISVQTVKGELQDFGIRVGARMSDIDRTAAANRFLQLHPELSWAAISFKGTTVRLELKEKAEAPPITEQKADFLVAENDGVIENVLVYSGKAAVSQGTVVKKGDLLISGYISGNGLQYTDNPVLRYEGASGKVTARVEDNLRVTVLFNEQQIVKEQAERCGIALRIFGKELKIGKVTEKGGHSVTPEKNVTLFGRVELPITYTECYKVKETVKTTVRDGTQAENEARAKALTQLTKSLGGDELCATEMLVNVNDEGVTVTVIYACIRDIATPKMKE